MFDHKELLDILGYFKKMFPKKRRKILTSLLYDEDFIKYYRNLDYLESKGRLDLFCKFCGYEYQGEKIKLCPNCGKNLMDEVKTSEIKKI